MKYLCAMLWPYKFLGKTLLSPSLCVFAKLCYFITCELDEIYNRLYSISAGVGGCSESCRVQLTPGREDSSRLQQLVWCTERWMWPLLFPSASPTRPAVMLSACAISPAGQEGFHGQGGAFTHVSTNKQAESLVPFLLSS